MTMSAGFAKSDRHAQLVWFDPGATTGIVALAVRPRWLLGDGDPTWEGFRRAVTCLWFAQVGRETKVYSEASERAVRPPSGRVVSYPGNHASNGRFNEASPLLTAEVDVIKQCEAVLDLWPDAAWGYESFVPRVGVPTGGAEADYLSPVRVYSALRYVELIYGERRRVPFVQQASVAKTTLTDDRARAAGLYRPGLPHAVDAARHAAAFYRRCRSDAGLRSTAWPRIFAKVA